MHIPSDNSWDLKINYYWYNILPGKRNKDSLTNMDMIWEDIYEESAICIFRF